MGRLRRTKLATPGVEPLEDDATQARDFDPRLATIHQPIAYPPPGHLYPTTGFPYPNPDVPLPTLTALVPATAVVGSPDFVLLVQGTNFGASSVIVWDGALVPTTYVSSTELSTPIVTAAAVAQVLVQVVTEGGASPTLPFEFTAPV